MNEQIERYDMLDLMLLPAFLGKAGKVIQVNPAAQSLGISAGEAIPALLATGMEEYAEFQAGCLYLRLNLKGQELGASVTRTGEGDIFLLEPDAEESELRALSLAARELRQPLGNLIAIAETLLPGAMDPEDPRSSQLLARMSRGLYQMQRILGNMSDAGMGEALSSLSCRNITQVFDDIFEKAASLLECAGIRLSFQGLPRDVRGLIDASLMERAVLNILSNAAKYLPEGGQIQAELTQRGDTLRLSIADNGEGVDREVLGSLFSRYLRQPGLEDPRHGLGLGMVMIRSAAASHGGTVLVDQPEGIGTRVTLTMKLRKAQTTKVCTPAADLTGGRDPALIELSQCLPLSVYQKEL